MSAAHTPGAWYAEQCVSKCARCNGTRLISRHFEGHDTVAAWDADDQPCDECADIHAVIAKAQGQS